MFLEVKAADSNFSHLTGRGSSRIVFFVSDNPTSDNFSDETSEEDDFPEKISLKLSGYFG